MGNTGACKRATAARPFVKWAGGKGQLLETFEKLYPEQLQNGRVKRYVEPFLGGGAVLFDVLQKFNVDKAYAFDINKELVNTYKVIKHDVRGLIDLLENLQGKYVKASENSRKEMYYAVREKFNKGFKKGGSNDISMAAWFIFLNRTCFNGLYRVNKGGLFNVPSGNYVNPTICDKENLLAVSSLLKNVEVFVGDFRDSSKFCCENTFMYFDPPYRPLNVTSRFTSYSKDAFDDESRLELGKFFRECDSKGSFLMLSNSDPKNVNDKDDFFDDLYDGFNIKRVMAKRAINSNAGKRGLISEILVTNY